MTLKPVTLFCGTKGNTTVHSYLKKKRDEMNKMARFDARRNVHTTLSTAGHPRSVSHITEANSEKKWIQIREIYLNDLPR